MTFNGLCSVRRYCFRLHQRRKDEAKSRKTEKLLRRARNTEILLTRGSSAADPQHLTALLNVLELLLLKNKPSVSCCCTCFQASSMIQRHHDHNPTNTAHSTGCLFWAARCKETTLKAAAEASESSFNRLYIRILITTSSNNTAGSHEQKSPAEASLSETSASASDARLGNLKLAVREKGGGCQSFSP